jgi:hypothetical protein
MHPWEKMRLKFCKPFANNRTKCHVLERVLGSRNEIQARRTSLRYVVRSNRYELYEQRYLRCEIRGLRCGSFEAALKLGIVSRKRTNLRDFQHVFCKSLIKTFAGFLFR